MDVSSLGQALTLIQEKVAGELAVAAKIRKDVAKKYPDLVSKEKDGNMGMGTMGPSSGALPGMVGGPVGGMGTKISSLSETLGKTLGPGSTVGRHLLAHPQAYDLAGLGVLAAPSIDTIHHELQKPKSDKREIAHAGIELAGLGTLAAPVAVEAAHKAGPAAMQALHKVPNLAAQAMSHIR